MTTVFIYVLKDPRDGAVRYIGKAKNPQRRLRQHCNAARKRRTHVQCWVSQVLDRGLFPALEILDEVPGAKWEFFERAYIKAWREAGADLTNATDGGDGVHNPPPESTAKRVAKIVGRPKSAESNLRRSLALRGEKNHQFGKVKSLQELENMRAAQKTGPKSAEFCERLRQVAKRPEVWLRRSLGQKARFAREKAKKLCATT